MTLNQCIQSFIFTHKNANCVFLPTDPLARKSHWFFWAHKGIIWRFTLLKDHPTVFIHVKKTNKKKTNLSLMKHVYLSSCKSWKKWILVTETFSNNRQTLIQNNKDIIPQSLGLEYRLSARDNTKLMGLCQAANVHNEVFTDNNLLQWKQQKTRPIFF